jgi:hypothetical protein
MDPDPELYMVDELHLCLSSVFQRSDRTCRTYHQSLLLDSQDGRFRSRLEHCQSRTGSAPPVDDPGTHRRLMSLCIPEDAQSVRIQNPPGKDDDWKKVRTLQGQGQQALNFPVRMVSA